MRPYFFKVLDNTMSILFGLFIVWPHFCSVKTALHLTGMDFRVIFVFLRRRRAAALQGEESKKHRKGALSGVSALVNRY